MIRYPRLLKSQLHNLLGLLVSLYQHVPPKPLEPDQLHVPTEEDLVHPRTAKLLPELRRRLLTPGEALVRVFPAAQLQERVPEVVVRVERAVKRLDGIEVPRGQRGIDASIVHVARHELHLGRAEGRVEYHGIEVRIAQAHLGAAEGGVHEEGVAVHARLGVVHAEGGRDGQAGVDEGGGAVVCGRPMSRVCRGRGISLGPRAAPRWCPGPRACIPAGI